MGNVDKLYDNLISNNKFNDSEIGSKEQFINLMSVPDNAQKFYKNAIDSGKLTMDELGTPYQYNENMKGNFAPVKQNTINNLKPEEVKQITYGNVPGTTKVGDINLPSSQFTQKQIDQRVYQEGTLSKGLSGQQDLLRSLPENFSPTYNIKERTDEMPLYEYNQLSANPDKPTTENPIKLDLHENESPSVYDNYNVNIKGSPFTHDPNEEGKSNYPISDWVGENISETLGGLMRGASSSLDRTWDTSLSQLHDFNEKYHDLAAENAKYGLVSDGQGEFIPMFGMSDDDKKTLSEAHKQASDISKNYRQLYLGKAEQTNEGLKNLTSEKIGSFLPLTGAIVGGALTGQPQVVGAGITGIFALSGMGEGRLAADNYEKQTGVKLDEGTKSLASLGYGAVMALPLGKLANVGGIIKYVPKNLVSDAIGKYMSNLLQTNPELVTNVGKEIVQTWSKQAPGQAKAFLTDLGKASIHSISTMVGIGAAQNAIDQFVIGKNVSSDDYLTRLKSDIGSGITLTLMTAPFAHFQQTAAMDNARKQRGEVTLSVNEKGQAVEIVPDQNGNTIGLLPNGKSVKVNQEDINRSITMTYEDFKNHTGLYKSGIDLHTNPADFDRAVYGNRLQKSLGKIADKSGNVSAATDSQGNTNYIVGRNSKNEIIGVNGQGDTSVIGRIETPDLTIGNKTPFGTIVSVKDGNVTFETNLIEGQDGLIPSQQQTIPISKLQRTVWNDSETNTSTQSLKNIHNSIMNEYDNRNNYDPRGGYQPAIETSETQQAPKPDSETILKNATEDAQNFVGAITHQESGNVIEAKLRGVEQPINITKGNIVLKEDGSIDIENSDKSFFYKTPDGRSHRGYTEFIEGNPSVVPAQEAIDKSIQPVKDQIANEQASEQKIGSKVIFKDENGINNKATIIIQNDDGSYGVISKLSNGTLVEGKVEPRQIDQRFNGVFDTDEQLVDYIDPQTNELKTGSIDLNTPETQLPFSNGTAMIDGNPIPFENIKGAHNETEVDASTGSATNGQLTVDSENQNNTLKDGDIISEKTNKNGNKISYRIRIETKDGITRTFVERSVDGSEWLKTKLGDGFDMPNNIELGSWTTDVNRNPVWNSLEKDLANGEMESVDFSDITVIGLAQNEEGNGGITLRVKNKDGIGRTELMFNVRLKSQETPGSHEGNLIPNGNETNGLQAAEASDTQGGLGQGGDGTAVQEGGDSKTQTASVQPQYPTNKKGELDFAQFTPEHHYQYAVETEGANVANNDLANAITQQFNLITKHKKKIEDAPFEKKAPLRQQLAALQAKLNELNTLKEKYNPAIKSEDIKPVEAAKKPIADKAAEQAQEEIVQGIPDIITDTAEKARLRGFRSINGTRLNRQAPLQVNRSTESTRKFSDKETVAVKRTLVEAEQLQPSHVNGVRNPKFFITEAQPKERTDKSSMEASGKIASAVNPAEITGGITAYTGAPIANPYGEILQGNNRTIGLQQMYAEFPDSAQAYKQYLIDNAADYGMTPEEVAAMNNPIAVDIAQVTDEKAIQLGQLNAADTESGGIQRIPSQQTANGLGEDLERLSNILFSDSTGDLSMAEVLDENGKKAIEYLYKKGVINNTQVQSAYDGKGNLTPEAKKDLMDIAAFTLFNGANDNMQQMFRSLPDKAQKAILQTIHRDAQSAKGESILEELHQAIEAYYILQQSADFVNAISYPILRNVVQQEKNQTKLFNSETNLPLQKYTNFALELAILFKSDGQNALKQRFNALYDNLQGVGGDMFNATEKLTLVEAIKKHFNNIDYVPNGQIQRNDVAGNSNASPSGQRSGNGTPGSGKPNTDGQQPTDSGTGIEGNNEVGHIEGEVQPAEGQSDPAASGKQQAVSEEEQPAVAENPDNVGGEKQPAEKEAGRIAARKQRILSEGTGFDKPFGLIPVSELKTVDDVRSNIEKILTTLKANEGNKTFYSFEGFAHGGKYAKNAGEQVRGYLMSIDVIPTELHRAFTESIGAKTFEDIVNWGEKAYKSITVPQSIETLSTAESNAETAASGKQQAVSEESTQAELDTEAIDNEQLTVDTVKQPWEMTREEVNTMVLDKFDNAIASDKPLFEFSKNGISIAIGSKLHWYNHLYGVVLEKNGKYKVIDTDYDSTNSRQTSFYISKSLAREGIQSQGLFEHYNYIRKSLAEGKPVPAEVLLDYPDLQEKYALKQSTLPAENSEKLSKTENIPAEAKYKNSDNVLYNGTEYAINGIGIDENGNMVYDLVDKKGNTVHEEIPESELLPLTPKGEQENPQIQPEQSFVDYAKAKEKAKKDEAEKHKNATIKFYDGTIITGKVLERTPDKLTIEKDGRKYSVPSSREIDPRFQIGEGLEPATEAEHAALVDQLKMTGLAKDVRIVSSDEIDGLINGDEQLFVNRQRDRWDNIGYTERDNGTKASVRAVDAESEGTFSEGNFRKVYGISKADFNLLSSLGIIDQNEWHHTGKSFSNTDFYSWKDSARSNGYINYDETGSSNLEEGEKSLSENYRVNKKEIGKLIKAYNDKQWEFGVEKQKQNVPSFDEFANNKYRNENVFTDAETTERARQHDYISTELADSGMPSFERRMQHEQVDDRYGEIKKQRIEELIAKNRVELEKDYNNQYGESIKENNEADVYNATVDSNNAATNGKEKTLIAISEKMGMAEDEAYQKAKRISAGAQRDIAEQASKAGKEEANKQVRDKIANQEKELQQWIEDNIADGKIIQRTRIAKVPENFVTNLTEMNGKYGWFNSAGKSYNMPEYYTGMEFSSKKLYDEYRQKQHDIILTKGDIQYFRTPSGTIYGAVKDGIVYLNKDVMNLNTPIHEYGHLYLPIVKQQHAEFYAKGVELIKETPYYEEVKNDPNYSNLDEDGVIDEALSRLIGDNGEKVVNEKGLGAKLKAWIKGVWERIGKAFSIKDLTPEQTSNLDMKTWGDLVNAEMLKGEKIENLNVKNEITETQKIKNQELIDNAVNYFGITDNFKVAGYLTTDGKLLDFSGRHYGGGNANDYRSRGVDHRDISEIENTDIIDFMSYGNIRLKPETDGFEITRKPTPEQFNMLKKYIRSMKQGALVDVSNTNGKEEFSFEYPKNTNPERIINDIKRYFDNGIRPVDSGMRFQIIGEKGALYQIGNGLKAEMDMFDSSTSIEEKHNAAKDIVSELDKITGHETKIVKGDNELIELMPNEKDTIDKYKIGGVFYNGEAIINTQWHENATDITIAYFHENTHFINRALFTPKEMVEFLRSLSKDEIIELLPKEYYGVNEYQAADEILAHAVEKIIEENGYEKFINNEVDLSLYSEPLRNKLQQIIDYYENSKLRSTNSTGINDNYSSGKTVSDITGTDRYAEGTARQIKGTVPESVPGRSGEVLRGKKVKISDNGFYSTVEKALDNIQQEKGTKDQFKAMLLKNGAKQAEMDWMGFDELPEKLNKTDIQNWINDNRIEVNEVQKSNYKKPVTVFDVFDSNDNFISTEDSHSNAKYITNENDGYYESRISIENYDETKYSDRILPGGSDYKELLLTIPDNKVSQAELEAQAVEQYGKPYLELNYAQQSNTKQYALEVKGKGNTDKFKSTHYDEPNILAHVRFNTREVNGEKVLFIEEFQSDWGQKGKKEGFKTKNKNGDKINTTFGEGIITEIIGDKYKVNIKGNIITINKDFAESPIPDMPFKKTDQWLNLAARRMMRYAAENGYDRIAWTNGEQQVERYDLKVGGEGMKTFYDGIVPITMSKLGKPFGAKVEPIELNTKIKNTNEEVPYSQYEKESKIPEVSQVQSIPVTESMKASVMENGVPLYQIIGEKGATELDKAEEATTRLDNLKVAREMETTKTPQEIRLATGWEKGVDGKWRYEVADGKLKLPEKNEREIKSTDPNTLSPEELSLHKELAGYTGTDAEYEKQLQKKYYNEVYDITNQEYKLSDIFNSEELYKSYPEIGDVKVEIRARTPIDPNGVWDKSENKIVLYQESEEKDSNNRFESTLIHEIQHAIQDIEGFAKGGNVAQFERNESKDNAMLKEYSDAVSKYIETEEGKVALAERDAIFEKNIVGVITKDEMDNQISDLPLKYPNFNQFLFNNSMVKRIRNVKSLTPHEKYQSLSGEVESRNASSRMNMTPEERKSTLLSETADVSPEDQIMIMDGLGVSNSSQTPTPSNSPQGGEPEKPKYSTEKSWNEYAKEIKSYNEKIKSIEDSKKALKEQHDNKTIENKEFVNQIQQLNAEKFDLETKVNRIKAGTSVPSDFESQPITDAQSSESINNVEKTEQTTAETPKLKKPVYHEVGHEGENFQEYSARQGVYNVEKTVSDGLKEADKQIEENIAKTDISEMNRELNTVSSKLVESYMDDRFPVKKWEAMLDKQGVKIPDEMNYYYRVTMVSGRINNRIEYFENVHRTPFVEALKAFKGSGWDYDAVSLYSKLKHAPEYTESIMNQKIESRKWSEDRIKLYRLQQTQSEYTVKKYWDEWAEKKILNLKEENETEYEEKVKSINKQRDKNIEEVNPDFAGQKAMEERAGMTRDEYVSKFENVDRAYWDKWAENKIKDIKAKKGSAMYIYEYQKIMEQAKDPVGRLWQKIRGINDFNLDEEVRSGMRTREDANQIKKMFEWYVPLKGHIDKTAETTYEYNREHGDFFVSAVKQGKGRSSEAFDPFTYMIQTSETTIRTSEKNLLNQTIKYIADHDTTGSTSIDKAWFVKVGEKEDNKVWQLAPEVKWDDTDTQETYMEKISEFNKEMKALEENGDAYQSGGKWVNLGMFIKPANAREHEVTMWQDGMMYTVRFNTSPRIAQAINDANRRIYEGFYGGVLRVSSAITRFKSASVTMFRPAFIFITNPMRDMDMAVSMSYIKYGAGFTKDVVKNYPLAIAAMTRNVLGKSSPFKNEYDKMVLDYVKQGGITGISHILELKKQLKELQGDVNNNPHIGHKLQHIYESASKITENQTRLAVYFTAIERGYSPTEATFMAKEITVNFDRSGNGRNGMKELQSVKMFSKVGFQALYNVANAVTENKGATTRAAVVALIRASIFGYVGQFMLSTLINRIFGDGDDQKVIDDFANLSAYKINSSFSVRMANGDFIHMALAQELRPFNALGMNFALWMNGKRSDTEIATDFLYNVTDLVPYNPINTMIGYNPEAKNLPVAVLAGTVDAATPLAELVMNRNFMGGKIYKEGSNPETPGYKQAKTTKKGNPITEDWMVNAARYIDLVTGGDGAVKGKISPNPDIYKNLLGGYLGGWFDQTNYLINIAAKDNGISADDITPSAIFTSSDKIHERNTGFNKEYYDVKEEMQQTKDKINAWKSTTKNANTTDEKRNEYVNKIKDYSEEKYNNIEALISAVDLVEKMVKVVPDNDMKDFMLGNSKIMKEYVIKLNKAKPEEAKGIMEEYQKRIEERQKELPNKK